MMPVDNLHIVDATAQAATTLCALIHAAFASYRDVLDRLRGESRDPAPPPTPDE